MTISVYQPDRKGDMKIYYQVRHCGERVFIDTMTRTTYPIVKTRGGVGFTLARGEQNMRAKQKRLEEMYWEIEEYIATHPKARPRDVKSAFKRGWDGASQLADAFKDYCDSGRIGKTTEEIMLRTSTKVVEFDPKADFTIDEEWLDRFSRWLRNGGATTNGVGLHLRNIRTVFNWARRKKMTKEYPFMDYRIKEERKPIKNMTLEQLREFKDYPCEPWQVEYRDLFMLMFYLCGVNAGDLLTCKKLTNGRMVFTRKKTGRALSVFVCDEARELIRKYKGKEWLLCPMDRYQDYHGYMRNWNDGLKKIGKVEIVKDKVGRMRKREIEPVFDGITTYVARYTWASIAAECGIDREIIAACLGHAWSDVTSRYIAYSQKMMDEAVKKVAEYVRGN